MHKLVFALLTLFMLIPSVSAQDDVDNLLEMLNAVPDYSEARESLISFIDYNNVIKARPGAPQVESYDALDNLPDDAMGLWRSAFIGISSGPQFIQDIFSIGRLMEETVGFEFFAIDRAVNFGNPPANFNVLMGEFDTDAIADALSERDYTPKTLEDAPLWCGNEDCDGTITDLGNINRANIFGGDLGRSFPLFVSDARIVATALPEGLILASNAFEDRIDSIAENANYVAAIHAIDRQNILIQGTFVHPSLITLNLDRQLSDEVSNELEQMRADALELAPYHIIMIADTATDTEQVVYITLVYDVETDAEKAVELIPARIETHQSLSQRGTSLRELFEAREITIVPSVIADDNNNRYVAVFEMRAPLAGNEEVNGRLVASSIVYRMFIQMIYSQDTLWLANRNS